MKLHWFPDGKCSLKMTELRLHLRSDYGDLDQCQNTEILYSFRIYSYVYRVQKKSNHSSIDTFQNLFVNYLLTIVVVYIIRKF